MNFKSINWGLVLVLFAVAVVGGVIAQLVVKEKTNEEGEVVRSLGIGGKKDSEKV